MKSTKTNKGITLIALIITIVVLLILAVVAISSITNDGILHYAQNATDSWNKASQNEVGILDGYLGYLNNLNNQTCNHTWEYGEDDEYAQPEIFGYNCICSNCGMICRHETVLREVYIDVGSDPEWGHIEDYECTVCGEIGGNWFEHEWNENYVCKDCEYVCKHDVEELEWEQGTDAGHQKVCSYCYRTIIEAHDYGEWMNAESCLVCDYACTHSKMTKYEIEEWGDDSHIYDNYCDFCGYGGIMTENCTYVDGKCTVCGRSE